MYTSRTRGVGQGHGKVRRVWRRMMRFVGSEGAESLVAAEAQAGRATRLHEFGVDLLPT
jgi:hypothetical protein